MATECNSMQLINGDGEFNVAGLERFVKSVKLSECGVSYAVVAIMGPQSSGKSTLLNNLFSTNFKEMNATVGKAQTTLGIWVAKAVKVEPLTIVMDIEGNDGQERKNDQTFEKKTALFALAIADVVMINIWCNDIGRENGAGKPLLRTIFEAMTKLFQPRKTTLLFVIRDQSKKTPLKFLAEILHKAINEIWKEIEKPESCATKELTHFFIVQVVGLPSYEHQEEQFIEEVAKLKARFINSIAPGGLAGDRRDVVPALAFSSSAQKIWKVIRKNKDLDLPDHKVMLATVRCEEIANKKYSLFCANKDWIALSSRAKSGPVTGFGQQITSRLETYLSQYNEETMYFDKGVCDAKRNQLKSNILQHVRPTFDTLMGHLLYQALDNFEDQLTEALANSGDASATARECQVSCTAEFDQKCADATVQQATDWDTSNVKLQLKRDMKKKSSSLLLSKEQSDRNAALQEANNKLMAQNAAGPSDPYKEVVDMIGAVIASPIVAPLKAIAEIINAAKK